MLSRMCNFYPRPPRGGRLVYQATTEDDRKFLSTPSARRATWTATLRRSFTKFLSTPSARRATVFVSPESSPGRNFYPRPPRGGRRSPTVFGWGVFLFLSTPSARRATVFFQTHSWFFSYFYPRPPRGGRRCGGRGAVRCRKISIHALREEGDNCQTHDKAVFRISIHALREEGDPRPSLSSPLSTYFYPRPPRGGRHDGLSRAVMFQLISIHALREEGDS